MTTWIISDTHFGHQAILKHQPARLQRCNDIESMDTVIIDTINKYVDRNDELWHLGDFAWKASRCGHYRARLNVRQLHILQGNHDSASLRNFCSSFNTILCRKFDGQRITLCHYPMVSWPHLHYGGLHLYGHAHHSLEDQLDAIWPQRQSMDVGIDSALHRFGEMRPFSLEEIFQILKCR